jgi:hypothetical protein
MVPYKKLRCGANLVMSDGGSTIIIAQPKLGSLQAPPRVSVGSGTTLGQHSRNHLFFYTQSYTTTIDAPPTRQGGKDGTSAFGEKKNRVEID